MLSGIIVICFNLISLSAHTLFILCFLYVILVFSCSLYFR
ncbi:putative membrane protein [Bacteroides fragilis str. S38L5]|nr:putative membrane protein [Bacteroides fragilis str. S38L5]